MASCWSASSLERNREFGDCARCHRTDHIAEFCPLIECRRCGEKGHMEKNCAKNKTVKSFSIHLPFDRPALYGSGTKCFRQCGLDHLLPYLEEAKPAKFGAVELVPNGNALNIGYDGKQSVVLAIHTLDHDAETIIRVQPTRVRVSAKYEICGGQLTEDTGKASTGGQQQNSPPGDIHVLLKLETLDDIFVRSEVNGTFYMLFWRNVDCGTHTRKAVTVITRDGFTGFSALKSRPAIGSFKEYFSGPAIKNEPPAIKIEDESDGEDVASQTSSAATSIAGEIVSQIVRTATDRGMAPDASVLTEYGFQRYFQPENASASTSATLSTDETAEAEPAIVTADESGE